MGYQCGLAVLGASAAAALFLGFVPAAGGAPGDVDRRFGTHGRVVSDASRAPQRLVVEPDGKIVIADGFGATLEGRWRLARFLPTGRPDNTFGRSPPPVPGNESIPGIPGQPLALARQADGSLVAAGERPTGPAVARFLTNGDLDRAFGESGVASLPLDTAFRRASALALHPDGGLVVAVGGPAFALVRLDRSGMPDGSFGDGGQVVMRIGSGLSYASGVVGQDDGKVVATGPLSAGAYTPDPENLAKGIALVRINRNGSLDSSFGRGGISVTRFRGAKVWPSAMVLQSDGKFLVAGAIRLRRGTRFLVVRYRRNGELDRRFGDRGRAIGDFPGRANALAVSKGNVVAAGWMVPRGSSVRDSPRRFALVGYDRDGAPDPEFGSRGAVFTLVRRKKKVVDATVFGLGRQPGRRIVAVGTAGSGFGAVPPEQMLVRYHGGG